MHVSVQCVQHAFCSPVQQSRVESIISRHADVAENLLLDSSYSRQCRTWPDKHQRMFCLMTQALIPSDHAKYDTHTDTYTEYRQSAIAVQVAVSHTDQQQRGLKK